MTIRRFSNSQVVLRPKADNPGRWQLVEPLRYMVPARIVNQHGGPMRVIVKVGFETDLASIPRLFWNIVPPFGKYTAAAIIHDYLYQAHEGSRAHADAAFLAAMVELGVTVWKRRIMYWAVRAFGAPAYNLGPMTGGIV